MIIKISFYIVNVILKMIINLYYRTFSLSKLNIIYHYIEISLQKAFANGFQLNLNKIM